MIASAKVVHKKYGSTDKMVYIGLCIDYEKEVITSEDVSSVDAVLTFKELRELFKKFSISERNQEFSEFDEPIGYKGSRYPVSNDLLQAGDRSNYRGILRLGKVYEILKKYDNTIRLTKGPADQIVKFLIEGDEIATVVVTKINIAHQDPNLPIELETRSTIVKRIVRLLEDKFLKEVNLTYL